ncbi:hypothetical protein ACJIZ3_012982 [Penstemon smallii]|uniref:DUF868 domain-containing protein n=1 Tax=Penstemon smallii TaxID=265156 RepID=A0ABD3UPX6_9LAMI
MFEIPIESSNSATLEQKPADEPDKPTQNFVTCIYRAKLADFFRNITITWVKTLISHSLYITVENFNDENHYTCKIDLKTWQFWGKKGLKTFIVDEKRVDVFWDLRSAKFTSSPEPNSDFYVAIVSEEEVVLLLGDQKKEAFRRTKSRPSLEDACLVHKKEIVFAKKCFCTKTTLGQGKREHNVIIESALSGPSDPEMWISIDGTESIRVTNLHWRFRGNETIFVDGLPVQILWDVHDWLYNGQHSGAGIFIFRHGFDESDFESYHLEADDLVADSAGFCHFLYAWKIE